VTPYATAWLHAFALTVVIELLVATPLLAPSGAPWKRRAAIVLLANLASHPLVWFVFPEWTMGSAARLGLSEAWAVGVEAAAYALVWPALERPRAFGVSALANGASLSIGLLLRAAGVPV
jgi:hypothetical protein